MNKTLLIIGGIILILIVAGVWAYLFMFGAPKEGEGIFANFGNSGGENSTLPDQEQPIIDTNTTTSSGGPQKLKQLTERPVAGAGFTTDGIRYMELGTGHIYDITLTSGSETLVTGTTIPKVVDATFSESGSRVAFIRDDAGVYRASVGTITKADNGGGVLDTVRLPEYAKDLNFDTSGEAIHYLETTDSKTSGHSYNIAKKSDSLLFSVPLEDVEAVWGNDQTYVYTTPSGKALGYIYEIVKGVPTYVTEGQYGLMGVPWAGGAIVTHLNNNVLESYLITDAGPQKQPVVMFEEKCVTAKGGSASLYCAAPADSLGNAYPDAWYKGVVSFSDYLWKIDVGFQEAEMLSNFLGESGREIDVKKIGVDAEETKLYFINKNDNTLWMYDLSL